MAADNTIAEKVLYNLLKTIVNTPSVPVYQTVMPDGQVPPVITYQRISTRFDHTLQARSQFTVVIFQIDVWAATDVIAGDISTKVHLVLDGAKQGVAEGQALFIMATNEISLFEENEKIHRRSMTYEVMIREYSA